ncbi:MAG: hypothetical protein HFE63_09690 [Clostridiales bacterium]|nr:hypothetical protein [Clostridiales bacterium]
MKSIIKSLVLLFVGGAVYTIIETVWRGYTHIAMFLVGGLAFLAVGLINEILPWNTPLTLQMLLGGMMITAIEFISGCILNLKLGLGIWDYSDVSLNLYGQICLPFALLWVILSLAAILLDDLMRWKLFGEDKPRYKLI